MPRMICATPPGMTLLARSKASPDFGCRCSKRSSSADCWAVVIGDSFVWGCLDRQRIPSEWPDDPARGVLAGARALLEAHGIAWTQVGQVVHGTTLPANAIIERKGAKTGLLTTHGFRDVLEIQRQLRY